MILLFLACSPSAELPHDTSDTSDTPVAEVELSVEVDPVHASHLWVGWHQDEAATAQVLYRVAGEEWRSTPSRSLDAGEQRQVLVGLPHGVEVELSLSLGQWSSEALTVETGPLPEGAPEASLVEGEPGAWDPGAAFVLLSLADNSFGSWVLVIDRQARVVWARRSPTQRVSLHPRVSLDGTELLLDDNSYWGSFDGGAGSSVARMKLDGRLVEEIPLPGLHHPYTDLPDGSILYTAMDRTSETLDRRWRDGTFTQIWDCRDLLSEVGESGFCGSNTLWYDPSTGHALNSIYSLETIVEVDLDSGQPVRWFGHTAGSWAFDPPETAFWWQHGGYLTEAGTLLTSSKGVDAAQETVVREYRLDEASQTLVEIWSFGEGEGVYGNVMGEAHRLANGNTLHNYGSATRLREVTAAGELVWDVDWEASTMGRSTPIADLYALVD